MIQRDPDDPRFAPVMLRGELVEDGWNDRAIAAMCRGGAWVRVRRGAYVEMHYWRRLDDAGRHEVKTRAVLKQANADLVVSHTSAVPFYDGPTWGLDLTSVHGTRVDGKAGRAEAGVRQHRGKLVEGDVTERHGVMVMAPERVAIEVTTVASTEAALVVLNHLLHEQETTIERVAERYARDMFGWGNTLRTDLVIRLADARIESPGETRTFYLLYIRGLPMPEPQYEIYDANGVLVGRVDFAWPELGVFLEFDGKAKYQKYLKPGEDPADVVVREKQREDLIRRITGWTCIRLVWADLERPARTAAMIRDVLFGGRRVAG